LTSRSRSTTRASATVLVVVGLAVTGCTSESTGTRARSTQPTGRTATLPVSTKPLAAPQVTTVKDLGLTVTGDYGRRPTVKPPTGTPPNGITVQVLKAGTGAKVALGQVLIAHYQVQTWGEGKAKPVVVDDSFARGMPIAAIVGAGNVLKNWDGALIGQKVGSRVVVTLPGDPTTASPPADQTTGQAGTRAPSGPAMLAVVDILAAMPKDTAAAGTRVSIKTGAGLPAVRSEPGKRPEVTGTSSVKTTVASSHLLLKGAGAAIASNRTLVLQVIQVDATTHKTISQTWGGTPILMRADQLLPTVPALTRSRVGSRAVAVFPASGTGHPQVLLVDVISQL
jgi:hypothetical protein